MEAFVVIALIGIGLLAAELLLPTGGILALLGIAGLVVGGILALGSSDNAADWIGGALITLAVLSAISFFYITRKVLRTTRRAAETGGDRGNGRRRGRGALLDRPDRPRLHARHALVGAARRRGRPGRLGDRVTVEEVDGLTLVVRPVTTPAPQSRSATPVLPPPSKERAEWQ